MVDQVDDRSAGIEHAQRHVERINRRPGETLGLQQRPGARLGLGSPFGNLLFERVVHAHERRLGLLAGADVGQAAHQAHHPPSGVPDDAGAIRNVQPLPVMALHPVFHVETIAARLETADDFRPDQAPISSSTIPCST